MDISKALEILGLPSTATPTQIKEAYRDLAKVWHPDRFSGDPRLRAKAEETLKRINEAHQVLLSHAPRRSSGPAGASAAAPEPSSSYGPRTSAQDSSEQQSRPTPPPKSATPISTRFIPAWAVWLAILALIGLISSLPNRTQTEAEPNGGTSSQDSRASASPQAAVATPVPMPTRVNIQGFGVVEFPAGMTQEQIAHAIETELVPTLPRGGLGASIRADGQSAQVAVTRAKEVDQSVTTSPYTADPVGARKSQSENRSSEPPALPEPRMNLILEEKESLDIVVPGFQTRE